jgi:hypothetical protein
MIYHSVLEDLKNLGLLEPEQEVENPEPAEKIRLQEPVKSETQTQSNFCPVGNRDCGFVERYDEMDHVFCCHDSKNAKNINILRACPKGHKPRLCLVKNEKLTPWFPSNKPEVLCVDCENLEKLYCTRSNRNAYVNIKALERCPDGKWTVDQETGSCETCALHDNPDACDSSEPMSWTTYAERCVKFIPLRGNNTKKE